MKIVVEGTHPSHRQGYDADSWEVNAGYLQVYKGEQLIAQHNQESWVYVKAVED